MSKKIMLACSAGMSTSLLVTKMQKAAEKDGADVTVFATSAADADNALEKEHPDVLMLGPQIKYMLDSFKSKTDIPVAVINMRDYGLMNGENVLHAAMAAIDTPKA